MNGTSSSCNVHRCLVFLVRGRKRRTYFKPANSPFSILPPDTPFTAAIQPKKASLCKHFQVSCLQQNPKAIGSMVEYKTHHKRLTSVFLHMVVEKSTNHICYICMCDSISSMFCKNQFDILNNLSVGAGILTSNRTVE